MLDWLKSLFAAPEPAGPPQTISKFGPSDTSIIQSGVTADEGGWRIQFQDKQTVRLFEVDLSDVEQCTLTYRAQIKTADMQKQAYLEMWCRVPGRGEFFSRGLHQPLKGTTDWASYEIPFYLKREQRADLIKLNVVAEGAGTLWIRNIELLQTPLK